MIDLTLNFIDLFTESAPWLLLGLFIAGAMKYLVPLKLLERHMSHNNMASVTKAAIIGAPLPLCSCGVIPAAIGLRRSGASPAATVSFLVSTPETGVDSISISYALLGPFMAIIRPISAIISAITAGSLVMLTQRKPPAPQAENSCCQSKQASCCPPKQSNSSSPTKSFAARALDIWHFSTETLLNDLTKWLLIGLALAACVKTWVPTEFLTQWGDSLSAMLVMALVGIPMYICASASTPIAAGFLAAGVSPGAVLVFMLAGPATNLATIGMIKQELGRSVVVTYVATIISSSILLGYLTNWLVSKFGFEIYQVAAPEYAMSHSWIYQVTALLLALLMLKNLASSLLQKKRISSQT